MCVIRCFFFNKLKCELGVHGEIDRCLVHVDDKTPITICAKDDVAHEQHEVKDLALDFGGMCCDVCVPIR
jgi:hypothetical protein